MGDGKRGRGSVAETYSKERIESTVNFPGSEIGRTLKVLFEPGAVTGYYSPGRR